MLVHNINPVAISIGELQIRWYGIIFLFGLLFSYYLGLWLLKKRGISLEKKAKENLLLFLTIGLVSGARLGSVLSDFGYYLTNPAKIIAVWEGGLAFHGALAGVIIAGIVFCKKYNIDFLTAADAIAIPVPFALALGRVANFINGEFYGKISSAPWSVQFPGVDGFRHPAQIYEALLMIAVFAALWLLRDKQLKKGTIFAAFLILYSISRLAAEYFKAPESVTHIFFLTWGQFWSVPVLLIGAYLLVKKKI